VSKTKFYNQIIMKNKKDGRSVWRTTFQKKKKRKKRKEYSVVYSSSPRSSCQVLLLCVVASNLFASTKIYLLLNQYRKKEKRKKSLSMCWRYSGIACWVSCGRFGFRVWYWRLNFALPFSLFCPSHLPFWKIGSNQVGQVLKRHVFTIFHRTAVTITRKG